MKIATTQYVENQIANDIGYANQTIILTSTVDGTTYTLCKMTLQKKAKQVICSVDTGNMDYNNIITRNIPCNELLPPVFRPKKNEIILVSRFVEGTPQNRKNICTIAIETNGVMVMALFGEIASEYDNGYERVPVVATSGWETE